MSEATDCGASADSASRKRCPSPGTDDVPCKIRKESEHGAPELTTEGTTENGKNSASDCKDADGNECNNDKAVVESGADTCAQTVLDAKAERPEDKNGDKPESAQEKKQDKSITPLHQLESAAIAAAEALASLTGRDKGGNQEAACSSEKGKHMKQMSKSKVRGTSKTQAAAADSSTTKEDAEDDGEADETDESVSGSSSTPNSSFASEKEENEDGECAIVSVKMAPEMRQTVTLLAQVQMKLEALERKSARLHQRLDVKINRLRRPHLDQRSTIAKTIPGFWVTALLNHPHLSAHIDETDEDALSYMTDLEIEAIKNGKLGYRIRFHFRRNPYFQNNIIMKELHLDLGLVGGTPISYSNPILWHRGHNLTTHSEPKKTGRGVYQTFFNWFSDHSNPAQDDVAQILKDDLFRDPLRYYLTPLWEPRENGGSASGSRGNGKDDGDDCVVISDSEEDPESEGDSSSRGDDREEPDDDEEEQDQDMNPAADESPAEDEEDEAGEIVIDGSDDSDEEDAMDIKG
ncbi:unnamed protein product [Knipowitschia caucasica]|uniref:Testis specific protein Y-linked n=2 Tax=Knipowitschia caucasica TaxID=637954 RepID=A0AAV2M089_KNICA